MGCVLWIQHLIDILPEFLQSFIQYVNILDRVITVFDPIWRHDSSLIYAALRRNVPNCYFHDYFSVLSAVKSQFDPEAVVCQCGADGLVGDPMATYNLTLHGLGRCVEWLMDWQLPTLLTGGGEA